MLYYPQNLLHRLLNQCLSDSLLNATKKRKVFEKTSGVNKSKLPIQKSDKIFRKKIKYKKNVKRTYPVQYFSCSIYKEHKTRTILCFPPTFIYY